MVELVLPKKPVKATSTNPRRLVIYSPPKMGKTTLLSRLPNCLIIDTERGSSFLDALKIEVNNLAELKQVITKIEEEGNPYDYIAIDTVTRLEEMVMPLAVKLYKDTPMGKNYKGDDVRKLPNGAGYLYFREALDKVLKDIESVCGKGLIIAGHIKEKFLEKAGKEVSAKDIDLTGKNRSIVCSDADAIGYLFRDGKNTVLNFASSEEVLCGSRAAHLKGQQILLGEDVDGELVSHWDKVYLPD